MKKLLGMILTLALAAGLAWPVYAESSTVPPEVTAHAYLVMDAQTGQVLVQKGGAERNYPASITKIMTLAMAMEKCGGDMTQQVTVSPDAVYSLEAGSSHVALQPGEVVSLNDLFHATILASANDAANVLAEYTAGSMEAFVELMNAKAGAGPGGHPFCKCQRPAQRRPLHHALRHGPPDTVGDDGAGLFRVVRRNVLYHAAHQQAGAGASVWHR